MIIDFGKSKPIEKSEARKRYTAADYIAPAQKSGTDVLKPRRTTCTPWAKCLKGPFTE